MSELSKIVEELRELLDKHGYNTTGWFVETRDVNGNGNPVSTLDEGYCEIRRGTGPDDKYAEIVSAEFDAEDGTGLAEFVCALVTHAPTLLAAAAEGERLREEVSPWREPTPEAPPEFKKLPMHASGGAECWHGHGVAVTALYCVRTRGFDRFEVYRSGRQLHPVGDAVNFIGWDAVVKAALTESEAEDD